MKRGILTVLALITISIPTLANRDNLQNNLAEINSKIITHRGTEQFRESIIFKKLNRRGYSGSSQYIEGIGELKSNYDRDNYNTDYSSKTKGFLTGTNSTFLSNPNMITGVSLGYIKSKVDYKDSNDSDQKVRTYGLNAYLAYNYNDFLFIGKASYDEGKNILSSNDISNIIYRSKNYSLGAEAGYFFDINEKNILYPHIGVNWNQYTTKGHGDIVDNNDRVGSGNLGVSYYSEISDKWLLNGSVEWNYDFSDRADLKTRDGKIKILETGRDTGTLSAGIGYYLQEDFLINLRYLAFINKNYYYDMVMLGFTHNF